MIGVRFISRMVLVLWPAVGFAQAPNDSPRPETRPGSAAVADTGVDPAATDRTEVTEWVAATALETVVGFPLSGGGQPPETSGPDAIAGEGSERSAVNGPDASPLPVPRPGRGQGGDGETPDDPVTPDQPKVVLAVSRAAVALSPRPDMRPPDLKRPTRIVRTAVVRTPAPTLAGPTGSVCGDPAIIGQRLSKIPGRLRGCGVDNPVRVTAVGGIRLSQGSTLNCTTAKALKSWVQNAVKPTVGKLGGGVASLRVAAHYSCRTRNNIPGAKVSEHGRGNAIDISAIVLKNGVSLSVLKGWRDPSQGKLLKAMHAKACGPFGTVLGPQADRYHQDHFHFDVARHRGGAYCR